MMKCRRKNTPETEAFLGDFALKTEQQRVPLSGGIEITRQCNLSCVHCYLGDTKNNPSQIKQEIDTKTWKRIIDEIVDAGCLFLLFTGGEPMLREDFADIYRHARQSGMIVTVFSNGTRLPRKVLRVFKDYPPHSVEITLYGATTGTYQEITRRTGEFEKCMANIAILITNGIPVELKTILMTKNRHELTMMQQMADDLGAEFRFDAAIFPCFDGDQRPLAYRVPPEEAVFLELSSEKNLTAWKDFTERMKGVRLSEALYGCSAGLNNFHIDPKGMLQPCLMVTDICYDLANGSFQDGWRNVIPKITEKKIDAGFKCRDCEKQIFCGFCPAFFRLETGSETNVSKYLCAMGNHMQKALMQNQLSGGKHAFR